MEVRASLASVFIFSDQTFTKGAISGEALVSMGRNVQKIWLDPGARYPQIPDHTAR